MDAVIKSSTDLRNNYSEISALCHRYDEPIFITKNGQGDLAVMSIKAYNALNSTNELRLLLAEGHSDVKAGRVRPMKEAIRDIRKKLNETV